MMSNAMYMPRNPFYGGTLEYPTDRGKSNANHLASITRQTLSTDAIGTFALTLTNLVVGSAIQIEDQAGTTTLYNGAAATTSQLINLSAYAGGSALNNLRIKVRKGSGSPYYLPFETLATAAVGAGSIYISQIKDE